jgi:SRSO17 transposase
VTRQYCGQLGKQDNCQVAVTLSVANHAGSLPVAWRLYLPEDWAADTDRRDKAGVPRTIGFATKPEIALEQIRAAVAAGIPPGVVLMDAGYGADTRLRTEITALGLAYVAGIQPHTTVWPAGTGPLPPKAWSGRGRPTSRTRRDPEHQPVQAKARSPSACPKPPGRRSHGARVRPIGSARAMRGCACAPRIAMTG